VSAIVAGSTATVGVLLAIAAFVDAHEHRLPNRMLAAACAVALGGALLSIDSVVVLHAILGLIVAGGLMLCVRVTRGVGMGDVKMAAVVGASVGACTTTLLAPATAIAVAALVGATYGFIANRQRVPFGPSLWFGWAATIALALVLDANGWLS
jgi:leader peptidase (prepilin peptidase)/N-methyltransferase